MAQVILVLVAEGVVQEVYGVPPGIKVRVKNYDVDTEAFPDLPRDPDGDPFVENEWTHEGCCGDP